MNPALEQLKVDHAYFRAERVRFAEWMVGTFGSDPIRMVGLSGGELVRRWLEERDSYECSIGVQAQASTSDGHTAGS